MAKRKPIPVLEQLSEDDGFLETVVAGIAAGRDLSDETISRLRDVEDRATAYLAPHLDEDDAGDPIDLRRYDRDSVTLASRSVGRIAGLRELQLFVPE